MKVLFEWVGRERREVGQGSGWRQECVGWVGAVVLLTVRQG